MIPILYGSTERRFSDNGIGPLGDCISGSVTEARNGEFELAIKYPTSGAHYSDLKLRAIIMATPRPEADPQPFRIYDISRPMNGIVTVNAQHISYDLTGIPVEPFTASSAAGAMAALKSNAVTDCPFDFWTDKSTTANMTVAAPSSIRGLLGGSEGSLLDVYGGEYEFDRWTVKLHGNRGYDRGVSIRYGKNLTDITQDENCESVYTGVYPYWADADGNLVQLDSKIISAPGTYDFTRILPLDLSQEWENAPTQEQLKGRAESYMTANNIGIPKVSITVEFAQLGQMLEYQHFAVLEHVELCDTVHVEFPRLGVSTSARVVKADYNFLAERYNSVTLGEARTGITGAIMAQGESIRQKPSLTLVQQAISSLTSDILGAKGGSVRLLDTNGDGEPDTLYIADDPDPAKAVKVWRFNYKGWGASTNGYNGPFTLGASLSSGIVADFITAGTLNANLIKAGVLTDVAGKNYWDMNNGEFSLSSAAVESGMTQSNVFNKLTNNGQTQGIYLQNGLVYINGTYIKAGDIDAANVSLSGEFSVYQASGGTKGGSIGYMQGLDDSGTTDGIGVADATRENYVIVTDAGVRIQTGSTRMYLLANGHAYIDGNLSVSGSITEHATQ